MPKVNKKTALERLEALCKQGGLLTNIFNYDEQRSVKWKRDARVAIRDIFEPTCGYLKEFDNAIKERPLEMFGTLAVDRGLTILKSMRDEVKYWPDVEETSAPSPKLKLIEKKVRVFIVHGRDEGAKETVARFLGKLKLETIILHEQPNRGMTIMEKLENYSNTAFAVILLTPDDLGRLVSDGSSLSPRARQNVVFELGYFIAKLGRERVCALHSEGIELPSDFQGMAYIPFDKPGAWKLSLATEIKAAGLDINMNDVI